MLTERTRLSVVLQRNYQRTPQYKERFWGDQTAKAMSEVVGQREEQNGRKANSQKDGDLCLY